VTSGSAVPGLLEELLGRRVILVVVVQTDFGSAVDSHSNERSLCQENDDLLA
jgi:hypothetical protein